MTSGGDSPGMNATIRAIVKSALFYHKMDCIGIKSGYDGLIKGKYIKLNKKHISNIIHKGGTILKSARSQEFRTKEGRRKAYINYKKLNLQGIIIIGGGGSFKGAMIFNKEYDVSIVGIPGTIDNDISGSDCTIGYDTALNTAITAIDKIRDTAISHDRLFFVEVMGRDTGFIALNAGLAVEALSIIIPEYNNTGNLFKLMKKKYNKKLSGIVIVSESKKSENIYNLAEETQIKYPHYDVKVSILGHIQRGGSPTCSDRILANKLGVCSVEALKDGKKDVMVGIKNHTIIFTRFEESIKKKNKIDKDLIRIFNITSS